MTAPESVPQSSRRNVAAAREVARFPFPDQVDTVESTRALQRAQRDLLRTAQLAVAGELVGGIAHDLRQPLAAFEMNVSVAQNLLRRENADVGAALAALDDAILGAEQLRESVQVLQDLVAGREPRITLVDLDHAIDEVVALVRVEAAERGVALEKLTSLLTPSVHADATMLREALLSLVIDAVESCDATQLGAKVVVSARALEDGNVELVVHHQPQVNAVQGNGWARSVARSVAEAHNATLAIDSDSTLGTTVRMTWPDRERILFEQ